VEVEKAEFEKAHSLIAQAAGAFKHAGETRALRARRADATSKRFIDAIKERAQKTRILAQKAAPRGALLDTVWMYMP
jgi:hypothetical protein